MRDFQGEFLCANPIAIILFCRLTPNSSEFAFFPLVVAISLEPFSVVRVKGKQNVEVFFIHIGMWAQQCHCEVHSDGMMGCQRRALFIRRDRDGTRRGNRHPKLNGNWDPESQKE
jgi:hypothetical protein